MNFLPASVIADSPADAGLPRRLIGQIAAVLFLLSGVVTAASPLLPAPPTINRVGVIYVGLAAMLVGGVTWCLPWQRWKRAASLWLVPIACLLISLHNYYGGVDPYRYGIFFMVLVTWIGVAHPRGTTLRFSPLLAGAYLAPLLISQLPAWVLSSAVYFVPVSMLVGEVLAWISARLHRVQVALHQSHARFRSLVQNSSDVITVTDHDTVIQYQSPAVRYVLGYDPDDLIGSKLATVIHPDDVVNLRATYDAIVQQTTEGAVAITCRVRHRDGSWRSIETIITNLLADPDVHGIVLNSRDVTERNVLQEQLKHQAFHDPLTGLANRVLFRARVEAALTRSRVAVLFLDLDNFKTINDSLGHAAGDQLLLAVAERVLACLRTHDLAARMGGDEFAVLLQDIHDVGDAVLVAERVIASLHVPCMLDGKEVFVNTSIGIAMSDDPRAQPDDVLRFADVAMYHAKQDGKGSYAVFEPPMQEAVHARLALEGDLQHALQNHEFVLHYQPIVDLHANLIVGVEALVRWQHPNRGLLTPQTFIPLAEETGLIWSIGAWVLHEACRQAQEWRSVRGDHHPFMVSVNLSIKQFQHVELPNEVRKALQQSQLDPACLVLEITESMMMEHAESMIDKLQQLKHLGVRLAVDDFGVGYSSLGRLQHIPIDMLKIDKSFVSGIEQRAADEALVRTIVTLGHTLGVQLVAEGIEQPDQVDVLRGLGCGFGQGYYFAKPLPAEAISDLLIEPLAGLSDEPLRFGTQVTQPDRR